MASEPCWLRGQVERIMETSQARQELRGKANTNTLMRRLAIENNTSLEEIYRWRAEIAEYRKAVWQRWRRKKKRILGGF